MDELHQLRSMAPRLPERIDLDALTSAAASDPVFRRLLDEFVRRYGELLAVKGTVAVESCEQSEIPRGAADSSEPRPELTIEPSLASSDGNSTGVPKRGFCDPAFESLLEELVQHYRAALPSPDAGSNPVNTEPQFLLPIPSSLSPAASQEGLGYESISGLEVRNLKTSLLTSLVVGFAICLGILLGMHYGRAKGVARSFQQGRVEGLHMVARQSIRQSEADHDGQMQLNGIPATQPTPAQDTHRKHASPHGSDGGLTVYQNDKVIFHLVPAEAGMPSNIEDKSR
jgi:hypothetical protein